MNRIAENHPCVDFFYFVCVIFFTVTIKHPIFLLVSLCGAVLLNFSLGNKKAFSGFMVFAPLFFVLSFLNPFVSHWGETVLFNCFGNPQKPFTFEALCYGFKMALTFLAVSQWFFSYAVIMTSEKFTYLFSRFIPSVSLMLTMIFRFLPSLAKKFEEVKEARFCAGLSSDVEKKHDLKKKIREAVQIAGTVFVRELEDGITTAKSMENRKFGAAKRTSYLNFGFYLRDGILSALYLFCAVFFGYGLAKGNFSAVFYPKLDFAEIKFGANVVFYDFVVFVFLCFFPFVQRVFFVFRWKAAEKNIMSAKNCGV